MLDLRESPGALGAAVQAGRCDCAGHGLLDEVVHAPARVLVQAGFGQQSGDPLETGFVTLSVTVCRVWREKIGDMISGPLSPRRIFERKKEVSGIEPLSGLSRSPLTGEEGRSLRKRTVISRISAFSSLE